MKDISGGAFNPAIGFFVNFVQVINKGSWSPLEEIWIYLFAPVVGGLCGTAMAWLILGDPDLNLTDKKEENDIQMGPPKRFLTSKF